MSTEQSECARQSCVLVAVGRSPSSGRARAYAIGLARRQNARLVVLHVRDSTIGFGTEAELVFATRQLMNEIVAEVRRDVREAGEHFGKQLEFRVCEGSPAAQILAVARELQADAVVVGHSRQRLPIFRSLSSRLIMAGEVPVIVVP